MQKPKTTPASKDAVSKLPILEVESKHCKKVEDKEELEPPLCTVCYENLPIGTKAQFMPCGHTFHPDCLAPWFKDHNTCPVCRFELP